ncbi:hypothetical protein [Halopenitus malekzadehii]|uniref:hypothetical protein n=1 Tax=Halopenitus malekzadehii TaxID=1267564 RepID=UPI00115FB02E|nr:hypothetical protein [Halopenitus malekzadehii]
MAIVGSVGGDRSLVAIVGPVGGDRSLVTIDGPVDGGRWSAGWETTIDPLSTRLPMGFDDGSISSEICPFYVHNGFFTGLY